MTHSQVDLKVWRTYVSGVNAIGVTTNLHGWALAPTFDEAKAFAVQQQLETQGITSTDFNITLVPTSIGSAVLLHNTDLDFAGTYLHSELVQQETGYSKSGNRLLVWQVVGSRGLDRILRIGKLFKALPIVHQAIRIWPALAGRS